MCIKYLNIKLGVLGDLFASIWFGATAAFKQNFLLAISHNIQPNLTKFGTLTVQLLSCTHGLNRTPTQTLIKYQNKTLH